ncbi:hypothetical protein [Flavobacterium antarcticum]|uniref:hypothetical protein n=1 Tax=Flavobacterium antarcticum TaxID=271155 RepID=UPI0003B7432F|nr:hypothetical protein [Flavobacterium antarcticum]
MNLEIIINKINALIESNDEKVKWFINIFDSKNQTFSSDLESNIKFLFTHETFQKIEKVLALTFENENHENSNVCFANNKDLRAEFKDRFSAEDVYNCLLAIRNLKNENASIKVIEIQKLVKRNNKAELQKTFWHLVESGTTLKTK